MARGKDKGSKPRTRDFTLDDFMDDVEEQSKGFGGGGSKDFLDIKRDGVEDKKGIRKVKGWIHPLVGLQPRQIHASSIPMVKDDGSVVRRRFNCAVDPVKVKRGEKREIEEEDCPLCQLIEFAKQKREDDHDAELVVLEGDDNKWTLGDLAQENVKKGKFGFRTNLKAKREYVTVFVRKEDEREDKEAAKIITASITLGKAIKAAITAEIDDRGKEKGNPLVNPWPFELSYNDNETDLSLKYKARRVSDEACEMDEDAKDFLESDPEEDLGLKVFVHMEPGNIADMMTAIESSWVCKEIPFEEFEEFMGVSDKRGSSRGKGEDEEEERPRSRRSPKDDDDEDDGDGDKGKKVRCPECKRKVIPDKKDKCPHCRAKLDTDVPF